MIAEAFSEPTVAEPVVAEPVAEPLPSGASDAAFARLPEALLHRVWAAQAFRADALTTVDGEPVRVVAPGRLNRDSGPDFSDARVAFGGVTWAGDVEIHRTSGDWTAHGHDTDPAYRRVVLHVVLASDRATGTLVRDDGSPLPEVVLLPHLDRSLRRLVRDFALAPRLAPHCAARWAEAPAPLVAAWLRACGEARLRAQTDRLARAYGRRPDLDRLLAGRVFRALGYEPNADAMETLAERLPWPRLRALADPLDALALVAGMAGWLDAPDLFPDSVFERWPAVSDGVVPMDRASWRSGGRPANRPRVRLAQAAALVGPGGPLGTDAVARFADALRDGPEAVADTLRVATADGTPALGADRARAVVTNAVLPVLALDAEMRGDVALDGLVVDALAVLPAASDHVTRAFEAAGTAPRSALDAHGMHELARAYCDEGRCARCAVGQHLYPGLARHAGAAT